MADKDIEKVCHSGITVEGVPLGKYLAEEEAEQEAKDYADDKHKLYHKSKVKILPMKQKSSTTRTWTRKEINQKRWKELLMDVDKTGVETRVKIDRAVLQVFLSGQEVHGRDLKALVLEAVPTTTDKSFSIRTSHLTRKTDLGKLIEVRRLGTGNCYKLVTAALDLTIDELYTFVYKDMKKREAVLERHKALRPYFEEAETTTDPITPDEPEPSSEVQDEPDLSNASKLPQWNKLTVEKVLSQALGVNVNISGRVEIVFKFGD